MRDDQEGGGRERRRRQTPAHPLRDPHARSRSRLLGTPKAPWQDRLPRRRQTPRVNIRRGDSKN